MQRIRSAARLTSRPHLRCEFVSRWMLAMGLSVWIAGLRRACRTTSSVRFRTAFSIAEQTPLGRLVQQRRAQDDAARSDSGFRLLDSVGAAFSSRLALIESAQRSLDLQYYAIHADASTEILLQALRDAARRGVRVRHAARRLQQRRARTRRCCAWRSSPTSRCGCSIPLPGSRASLIGRVISVVEGRRPASRSACTTSCSSPTTPWASPAAATSGTPISAAATSSNFVDLDVLAAGPHRARHVASFDRYWNNELAYPVQSLVSPKELEELRKPPAHEADPSATIGSRHAVQRSHTAAVLPT